MNQGPGLLVVAVSLLHRLIIVIRLGEVAVLGLEASPSLVGGSIRLMCGPDRDPSLPCGAANVAMGIRRWGTGDSLVSIYATVGDRGVQVPYSH